MITIHFAFKAKAEVEALLATEVEAHLATASQFQAAQAATRCAEAMMSTIRMELFDAEEWPLHFTAYHATRAAAVHIELFGTPIAGAPYPCVVLPAAMGGLIVALPSLNKRMVLFLGSSEPFMHQEPSRSSF